MANTRDSLGDRMKGYESCSKNFLTRRVPVIIRLDGKAFHTFTKGFHKPFDRLLMNVMQLTMKELCENIQGCVFGYTQSDEITLVLTDYATIKTDAWFGYNVQKMTSIAASMATLFFNKYLIYEVQEAIKEFPDDTLYPESDFNYWTNIADKKFLKAQFDARAFSVPKDDVCNCLIWRQQDATRNSIEAAGQAQFSHRELMNKNCNQIQDMLWTMRQINWNDYPTDAKRGACCYKTTKRKLMINPRDNEPIDVERRVWVIDRECPIFTQDRDYIEKWL